MAQEQYIYELIDIKWSLNYDFAEPPLRVVRDNPDTQADIKECEDPLVCDEVGVPISGTRAEQVRRVMILSYFKKWHEDHPDPRIFNNNLNDYIIVNHIFLREATGHSAKSYLSTKAALRFETLIKDAEKVAVTKIKEGDKSQKGLQEMIVMRYTDEALGTVKLTVGVKLRSHDKVQYGISVPPGNQPLVDAKLIKHLQGNKNKKHLKK